MAASWSWPIPPSSSTSLRPCKGFQEQIAYLRLSVSSKEQGYQRERAVTVSMAKYKYKYKYKGTRMREKLLTEMIEKKAMEAKEVCKGDEASGSDECKVAWDQVEEVSQAKAHLLRKLQTQDPLEYFCRDNPQLDECQIYEE